MEYDLILARYGEIGLKSRPIRRRFERTLQDNIERAFEQETLDVVVQRIPGRFLVNTSDISRGLSILSRIFGLTSVSPTRVVPSDLSTLLPAIAHFFDEVAAPKPHAKTFAIRARRSGQHPYTSQDVAREGGGAVLDRPGGERWKVNLEAPDIEVSVEVRDHQAFLYDHRIEAPGGLPMGTQGKVVVLLKDLNSLVAAWLMLKRGCTVYLLHFQGLTGRAERAEAFLEVLRRWYLRGGTLHLPHEETASFPQDNVCGLCMRQMIRKADLVARRKKAKAIVTGETFGSTTVDNLTLYAGIAHVPILRPVLGMTPAMISEFAKKIGIEVGRNEPFSEPCPLRTRGSVMNGEKVRKLELELGLEAHAHQAIRARSPVGVTS